MLKVYNSLGRELQEFKPFHDKKVGMYTCGPTVYSYVTVGNWRTYVFSDLVNRGLRYLGYDVKLVMNITDVGHLTGDNEGDSSSGEDRMEKAERKEGKTAWEIADFYANDFYEGIKKMNMIQPDLIPKPTEHIDEQIKLVQEIESRGYTYKTSDGIYFDIQKYEADGNDYGELSNLDEIKEGARVAINEEKKDPRDFALWKFSPTDAKRHMEWDSPWGIGFPGWHIECSAMGMKYLGDQFDLHLGGEDLMSTHHPCEIAQSEAASEKKPFVKYWMHGAFLLVDGGRMGKSLGNAYTIQDIEDKGYSPLDLRYFYFSGHYRKKLNFTWENIEAAKVARHRLVNKLKEFTDHGVIREFDMNSKWKGLFNEAIEDDFNMPKAISVVWDMIKATDLNDGEKLATILRFDSVLGLDLANEMTKSTEGDYSPEVQELIKQRHQARLDKNYELADSIRDKLKSDFNVDVKDR